MATTQTASAALNAKIAALNNDSLLAAILAIGAATDTDKVVVRVRLLAEYERREGGEAVDILMDTIGL